MTLIKVRKLDEGVQGTAYLVEDKRTGSQHVAKKQRHDRHHPRDTLQSPDLAQMPQKIDKRKVEPFKNWNRHPYDLREITSKIASSSTQDIQTTLDTQSMRS